MSLPDHYQSESAEKSYLVKCARTDNIFRMRLRRAKAGDQYVVTDFEFLVTVTAPSLPLPQRPQLPPPREWIHLLVWWWQTLTRRKPSSPPSPRPLQAEDIEATFQQTGDVDFSEINFDDRPCPACGAVYERARNVLARWALCGSCRRLFCAGGLYAKDGKEYARCPWCRSTASLAPLGTANRDRPRPVYGALKQESLLPPGDARPLPPAPRHLPPPGDTSG